MGRGRIVISDFVGQIGARVRCLRFERGLSLRTLAELAECSPDGLMQIELGRAAMTIGTMRKLARALDVQPLDILNHDPHTMDLGWFLETMRHNPDLVRFVLVKLDSAAHARAARAARRPRRRAALARL